MTADESIAALKELLLSKIAGLESLINSNDALYTERDTSRRTAVEAALKAAQTGIDAAFASSEKSSGKSEINAEKWRENANEWRAAMMDRENRFASRVEVDNELKNLRYDLASVKEVQAIKSGSSDGSRAMWGYVAAGFGFLLTLLAIVGAAVALLKP